MGWPAEFAGIKIVVREHDPSIPVSKMTPVLMGRVKGRQHRETGSVGL